MEVKGGMCHEKPEKNCSVLNYLRAKEASKMSDLVIN